MNACFRRREGHTSYGVVRSAIPGTHYEDDLHRIIRCPITLPTILRVSGAIFGFKNARFGSVIGLLRYTDAEN